MILRTSHAKLQSHFPVGHEGPHDVPEELRRFGPKRTAGSKRAHLGVGDEVSLPLEEVPHGRNPPTGIPVRGANQTRPSYIFNRAHHALRDPPTRAQTAANGSVGTVGIEIGERG